MAQAPPCRSQSLEPPCNKLVFYFLRYMLNVKFNILNKQIYNFFPFPWCVTPAWDAGLEPWPVVFLLSRNPPGRFVSVIHLVVGLVVMSVFWATKVVPFQKPDESFLKDVSLPAFLHAFGHCLTNVSFAAVAVSFTHTVKSALPARSRPPAKIPLPFPFSSQLSPLLSSALEPVFSAAGSYMATGTAYPLPVYLALIPIMAGASAVSPCVRKHVRCLPPPSSSPHPPPTPPRRRRPRFRHRALLHLDRLLHRHGLQRRLRRPRHLLQEPHEAHVRRVSSHCSPIDPTACRASSLHRSAEALNPSHISLLLPQP